MLRCAGCGAPFSEWAARCPSCRRLADDAADLPEPGRPRGLRGGNAPVAAGGRRRRRRSALVAVAALAAVTAGAGTWAARTLARAGAAGAERVLATAAGGRVILVGSSGATRSVVGIAPAGGLTASPDGRELVTGSGRAFRLAGRHLLPAVGFRLPAGGAQVVGFADDDRSLLVSLPTSGVFVSLELLGPGPRVTQLGEVVGAVADPAAPAAFAVAGAPQDVSLLRPGRLPRVLVSADRVAGLLGLPVGGGVALLPVPDRAGNRVAVVAIPLDLAPGQVRPNGIVVVDTSGAILGVRRDVTFGLPAWSPGGRSLVWAVPRGPGGLDGVAQWTVGPAAPVVSLTAHPGPPLSSCLPGATGRAFLCVAVDSTPDVPWALGQWGRRQLVLGAGPSQPLVVDPPR